ARRPGYLCAQFLTITGAELADVAALPAKTNRPSALQAMTAQFFSNEARNHVHTVVYTAPGTYVSRTYVREKRLISEVVEDAPSYFFLNRLHPHADDPNHIVFRSQSCEVPMLPEPDLSK